jgi:hypothetical protein
LSGIASGQHQNGDVDALTAQFDRELKAVPLGQLDVDYDEVVRVEVTEKGALVTVGRNVDGVALFLEPLLEKASVFGSSSTTSIRASGFSLRQLTPLDANWPLPEVQRGRSVLKRP